MTLLYVLIEELMNANKRIETAPILHEGVNLSSEYEFFTEFGKTNNGQRTINIRKKKLDTQNLKKHLNNQSISEITGIIGDNGSGKTTLLYCLHNGLSNLSSVDKYGDSASNIKMISIWGDGEEHFYVFHNLTKENHVFFEKRRVDSIANPSQLRKWEEIRYSTTNVYFTNSNFTSRGFETTVDGCSKKESQMVLKPDSMRYVWDRIIGKTILMNKCSHLSYFYKYLQARHTDMSFINLTHFLFKTECEGIKTKIPFKYCENICVEIDDNLQLRNQLLLGNKSDHKLVKPEITDICEGVNELETFLLTQFEYEKQYFCPEDTADKISVEEENIIKKEIRNFSLSFNSCFDKNKREINIASSDKNKYIDFSNFLKNAILNSEKSYLLPKLHVYTNSISDGENAFLNLFSWLHFMVRYRNIADRDNYILLLDEIDLYMHPEWQKNIVKNLIDSLASSGKTYQMIFTTHSPIVVSDLFKDNLLKINKINESKSLIAKEKRSTFGQGVETTLSESFGITGSSSGKISAEYIDGIFDALWDNEESTVKRIKKDDVISIEKKLSNLSDSPIKRNLQQILEAAKK